MKRSIIETILGALVIFVAGFFLTYSYKTANVSAGSGGYEIGANFSGIGGLKAGDDVQISGVKIGTVSSVKLNPETFLARVNMMIDDSVQLPVDTAALISSESLLGGRYLALEPGADEELLKAGDVIEFTQAPQNLEQLLGQFIFSATKDKDEGEDEETKEAVAANEPVEPAPATVPSPVPEVVAPAMEAAPAEAAQVPAPAVAPAPVQEDVPVVTEPAPEAAPSVAPAP